MYCHLPSDEPSAAAGRLPDDPQARAFRSYAARASQPWSGARVRPHPRHGGGVGQAAGRTVGQDAPSLRVDRFAPLSSQPVLPAGQDQHVPPCRSPHSTNPRPRFDPRSYRDPNGLITLCVACHRIQRPGTDQWDDVPEWEQAPPDQVTGGLCGFCFKRHFARYFPPSSDQVA